MYIGNNKIFPITSKGDSAFIRYSAHADGADFTEEWNEGQNYIGFATGQIAPTDKESYKWCKFTGEEGTSGDSVFIRYSADADPYGADFTETWSEGQNYIGIATGQTAPTYKMDYQWCKFVGEGGADMSGYLVKPEANKINVVPYIDGYGEQIFKNVSNSPYGGYMPIRDGKGNLTTNEPTADLHCANKKYVDDMIAAISGGGEYTVNFELTIEGGSGVYVSKKLPTEFEQCDLHLNYDTLSGTLEKVSRLYFYVNGGCCMIITKDGETLINCGYDDSGSFSNVANNYIDITEDCTLSVYTSY